jgi:hypothetical protein
VYYFARTYFVLLVVRPHHLRLRATSFVATDFDWFERGQAVAPGAYAPLPFSSTQATDSSDVTVPPPTPSSTEEGADDGDEVSLSSLEVARLLAHQSAYDAGMLEGFSGGFVGTAALLAEAVSFIVVPNGESWVLTRGQQDFWTYHGIPRTVYLSYTRKCCCR